MQPALAPTEDTRFFSFPYAVIVRIETDSRRDSLVLAMIVFAGLLVRAFRLGHQSLWTDEVLTSLSSTGSLSWIVTQKAINTNIPPLYYVIVHFFLTLGRSEEMLRLPSVLFGAASIALLYFCIEPLLGRRVALLSAGLLALSPFHVWYSQEARPYALFLFLSLVSLLLLQQLNRRPSSSFLRMGFALAAASTFYCHTLGLPFIAFLAVYALLQTPPSRRTKWIPLFAVIAVLLLPAIYRLLAFAPNASADANRPFDLAFVPYAFWAFSTGYSIGPTLTELHLPTRMAVTVGFAPIILSIALVFAVLVSSGVVALWRRSYKIFWIVACWFGIPFGFAIAGTLLTRHPFNVRYAILALPAWIIAVSMGVMAARSRSARAFALAALGVVSIYSLGNYFFHPHYWREDNRAAGTFLAAHAAPHDVIIVDAPYTAVNLQYYARREDVLFVGYPYSTPLEASHDGLENPPLFRGQTDAPGHKDVADTTTLRRLVSDHQRFWLFLSRTYHGAPANDVLEYCDRHFRRERQLRTRNDIMLVLYVQPAHASVHN